MFTMMLILSIMSIMCSYIIFKKLMAKYPTIANDIIEIFSSENDENLKTKYLTKMYGLDVLNYETFLKMKALVVLGLSIVTSFIMTFATIFLNGFWCFLALFLVFFIQIIIFNVFKIGYEKAVSDYYISWK